MAVKVGVFVAVLMAVKVGVFVGVFVDVLMDVLVGVSVGVSLGVRAGVSVGVSVDVLVSVSVGVSEGVKVGVSVGVLVAAVMDVLVGVAVGDWQKVETEAGAAPPPEVSNSNVPKSPLVLTLVEAPAFNWKVLLAMGVPFNNRVHVPGPVMFEPMLVIVNVPWASGVQLAESDRVGAGVGVRVGVAVGDWQKVETEAGAVPPPDVSNSNVPKRPLVLMLVEAPAFNWKVLLAIGVPFSNRVHVPGPVMFEPMLVIVNVPWASGVQLAESEITGAVVVWAAAGNWLRELKARTRVKNNAITEYKNGCLRIIPLPTLDKFLNMVVPLSAV